MSFSVVELQILAGIAEGRTLSEIGDELYLHQPAVSRALRLAQNRTGLQLVERVGRRLQLTLAGAQVAAGGDLVLRGLREVDFLVDRLQSGQRGTVRILAAHTPANYVLPPVIGKFIAQYEQADVSLRAASSGDIWQIFCDGPYDLGVVPVLSLPAGMHADHLYDDRLCFYVGPGSPLADRAILRIEDLRGATLIGPFFQPHWSELWERALRKGLTVSRRMDVAVGEGVKRLVARGAGVGMLYRSAIADELAAGVLIELACPEITESISYSLVQRSIQPLRVVEQFSKLLRAAVATSGSDPGARGSRPPQRDPSAIAQRGPLLRRAHVGVH